MGTRGHDLVLDVVVKSVAMREVDVRALGHATEKRACLAVGGQVNLVPADVRHLEASGAQARGAAAQHAQAVDPALGVGRAVKLAVGALVPALKEQLQAQADA